MQRGAHNDDEPTDLGISDIPHRVAGRPRLWTVHLARQMRSPVMVIGHILSQETLKWPLMQNDHMIKYSRRILPMSRST